MLSKFTTLALAAGLAASTVLAPAALAHTRGPHEGQSTTCAGRTVNRWVHPGEQYQDDPGGHVIEGTDDNDWIYARGGDDVVCGRDGNDHLFGGGGNDILYGNDGNDTLEGGTGTDRCGLRAGNNDRTDDCEILLGEQHAD